MRFLVTAALAASISVAVTSPVQAVAPVAVTFGTTWDAPWYSLQNIVDGYLGVPGAIDVTTAYIGHNAGEIDPWFWVDNRFSALLVTEVAGNANNNVLGWYKETDSMPTIDGVDDGIIFNGADGSGASAIVTFAGTTKFGFYMNPNGPLSAGNAPEPELFFTNRFYNDLGPDGSGALHAPFDGDVQAVVYDVSQWKGANTWLVCFEDLDSGAPVTSCCSGVDNDFNDLVFEVKAFGATPTQALTFGRLKAMYKK